MRFICVFKRYKLSGYVDGNTPYTEHGSIDQVISRLEETAASIFKLFPCIQIKADLDKFSFLHPSSVTTLLLGCFIQEL